MSQWLTQALERISLIRQAGTVQFEHRAQWLMPSWRVVVSVILILVLLITLAFEGSDIWRHIGEMWRWYKGTAKAPFEAIAPLITLTTAVGAGFFAMHQHFQTLGADRERRITETYSKAVEQLAHANIEVRLGGIYTLERISRESPKDYWTIMETLTAFVRDRARQQEPDGTTLGTMARFCVDNEAAQTRKRPLTDIAAVLAIIVRRDRENQRRERDNGWRFDLRETDLRGADLEGVNLREANLRGANLSQANLRRADLSVADLSEANLQGADLMGANLNGYPVLRRTYRLENDTYIEDVHSELGRTSLWKANLEDAGLIHTHLEDANLTEARLGGKIMIGDAHLQRAWLRKAHLEGAKLLRVNLEEADLSGANLTGAMFVSVKARGADLRDAHLEGAKLRGADLEGVDLATSCGDAHTELPDGVLRPASWPPNQRATALLHEGR